MLACLALAACAEVTEPLPEAPACQPLLACVEPVPTSSFDVVVDDYYCPESPNGVRRAGPSGVVGAAIERDGCARYWVSLTGVAQSILFLYGVANCCDAPRYIRAAAPAPVPMRFLFGPGPHFWAPDPDHQPVLATFAFEGEDAAVVTPACAAGPTDPVCTSTTACQADWRAEIPPGTSAAFGAMIARDVALPTPQGFLPQRLVAYLPPLNETPDAPPAVPASALLCDDPKRLSCLTCPAYSHPVRVELDLTQAEGVAEILQAAFLDDPG